MMIDLTKSISDKMVVQRFVFCETGRVNRLQMLSFLRITDNKMSALELCKGIKTKIFHFMIACAQKRLRIEKHEDTFGDYIFLIGKTENQCNVHLGGSLKKSDTESIKPILETVNDLPTEGVKKKFYTPFKSETIIIQEPLVMSLLDILKKTKEKIRFRLLEINEETMFLLFTTIFSTLKHGDGTVN
jgi:hypothetical protein